MTPEAMKLRSDGARPGSWGCWIPKLRLFLPTPPMGRGTLPCCPPQRPSLPWFSSPIFLAFIRRQETQVLCSPPTSPVLPPGLWHRGDSRTLPVQSWVLRPKPGTDSSPGSIAVQGSARPLPQEADPSYPVGLVIQLHPPVPS